MTIDIDISKLDILEASKLLREGKTTSLELTEACLNNIKKTEHLNIYTQVFALDAVKEAKQRDEQIKKGILNDNNLLYGIPVSVKDLINIENRKTTCASKFLENYTAQYDADVISKIKNAGVVIVGKNNLDEFAMGGSTENSYFGVTKNPVNDKRVSGGSSGGSAAAVKAGTCFASLGTDTGGSIRQPAAFCGVVGVKPSYGRVSRFGSVAFASSLDQIGPFGKTVADTAIMLETIAGQTKNDSTASNIEVPNYLISMKNNIKGMKVGIAKEIFELKPCPEMEKSLNNVVAFLEKNGAEIINLSLPNLSKAISVYYIIASAEAASNLARFDGVKYGRRAKNNGLAELYLNSRTEGFGDEVKRRIMLGNFILSAGYADEFYKKGIKARAIIKHEFAEAFKKCDILLCPTTQAGAFEIGAKNDPVEMYKCDVFTVPFNIAGVCGISVPCGVDNNNMPLGIQFVADCFKEQKMFDIANYYEKNFK